MYKNVSVVHLYTSHFLCKSLYYKYIIYLESIYFPCGKSLLESSAWNITSTSSNFFQGFRDKKLNSSFKDVPFLPFVGKKSRGREHAYREGISWTVRWASRTQVITKRFLQQGLLLWKLQEGLRVTLEESQVNPDTRLIFFVKFKRWVVLIHGVNSSLSGCIGSVSCGCRPCHCRCWFGVLERTMSSKQRYYCLWIL